MTMQALHPTEARTRSQTPNWDHIVHPIEYTDADRKECGIKPIPVTDKTLKPVIPYIRN
jgi:hypothetical protein